MSTPTPFFKYVCLSGWPKVGKDEVAKALQRQLGFELVDDGLPLRLAAPLLYGFDESLPFSQEGKATLVETPTGPRTVRDLLGTLGNHQEAEFGTGFMPFRALQLAAEVEKRSNVRHFVFPSVRKDQGKAYKQFAPNETLHLEVRRPGVPESPYAFDKWDPSTIDHVVDNDGTLEQLDARIADIIKFWTKCRNTRRVSHC